MNRESVDWRGYIPAITTPFDKSGGLDLHALNVLLEWLVDERQTGLIALGTQGEWFTLTNAERSEVLKTVGTKLAGKMTLIAGCSAFTASQVIENAELAKKFKFDGILVTPPPYMIPTQDEIFDFYRCINDEVRLPICVYNWPPGTGITMSLSLVDRLAELEMVVAIKNSTAGSSLNHFLEVFYALNDRIRVFGMPTNRLGISLCLNDGAVGTMGAGAVLGRNHVDYFEAIWRDDLDEAVRLGEMNEIFMKDLFNADYTARYGSSQGTFKAALNLQGVPGGHTRAPLTDLDNNGIEQVARTLQKLGRI